MASLSSAAAAPAPAAAPAAPAAASSSSDAAPAAASATDSWLSYLVERLCKRRINLMLDEQGRPRIDFPGDCWICGTSLLLQAYQGNPYHNVSFPSNLNPGSPDYPFRLKEAYRNMGLIPNNEAEHSISQVLLQHFLTGQITKDLIDNLVDMIESGNEIEKKVATDL